MKILVWQILMLPFLLFSPFWANAQDAQQASQNSEIAEDQWVHEPQENQYDSVDPDLPTPQTVDALIKQKGAESVVNDLWDSGEDWDFLTSEIGRGNADWINLLPQLIPGTDSNSAESLGTVLAAGLPKNPLAVIQVLDDSNDAISTERVCSISYIEPRHEAIVAYYQSTRIKLLQAGKKANKCLASLDAAMEYVKLQAPQ